MLLIKVVKNLGYNEVKELQFKMMLEILNGHDVFAAPPTRLGKSLCYGGLPVVFHDLNNPPHASIIQKNNHTSLIIHHFS